MTFNAPYAGVKVLELARILAGPWAGQLLADLGADVIKIESPSGDETRRWGPPFVDDGQGRQDAAYFHSCNRGKRSVIADFRTEGGVQTVRDLAAEADVVIENFKLGGLDKFGLDYENLKALNPSLIYCSITGFGHTGPRAADAGYDIIGQAMSGLMDLTGEADSAPQKTGVPFADIFTGVYSAVAIQAALAYRARTGQGQHIDMSLLDCMVGVMGNQAMNHLIGGLNPTRIGNNHANIVPYGVFRARDDWFILAIGSEAQFERFCEAVGLQDVPKDSRFSSNAKRVINREAINSLIAEAVAQRDCGGLIDTLRAIGLPAARVNSVAQAFKEEQIVERGMQIEATRSNDGARIAGVRAPIVFSESILTPTVAAPTLGTGTPEWRKDEK